MLLPTQCNRKPKEKEFRKISTTCLHFVYPVPIKTNMNENLQGDRVVTNSGFKEVQYWLSDWGNHMFSIILRWSSTDLPWWPDSYDLDQWQGSYELARYYLEQEWVCPYSSIWHNLNMNAMEKITLEDLLKSKQLSMQVNIVILQFKICPIYLYVENGSSRWLWITCDVFYSGNIEITVQHKMGRTWLTACMSFSAAIFDRQFWNPRKGPHCPSQIPRLQDLWTYLNMTQIGSKNGL